MLCPATYRAYPIARHQPSAVRGDVVPRLKLAFSWRLPLQQIITRLSQDQLIDTCGITHHALADLHDDEARRDRASSQEDGQGLCVEYRCMPAAPMERTVLSAKNRLAITICLRAVSATISVDEAPLYDGVVPAGAALVTLPEQTAAGVFAEGVTLICLHLPWDFVIRHAGASPVYSLENFFGLFRDEAIANLARALDYCGAHGCAPGWTERFGASMVARLFHLHGQQSGQRAVRARVAMPRWRIKRVCEYLATHLSEPISLADMARAAGLSPMHFAAQFRLTTGHRPHEYLQLCRIEQAKRLLLKPSMSLIDIAIEVGFCTQSHFATVFKRYVGMAPSHWRDQQWKDVA
jgi:AraC-like DNA-binding protein